MQRILITTFLIFLLFVVGCKKNETSIGPTDTAPTNSAPTVPSVSFKGPTTTSTDLYAGEAKSYASTVNSLMSLSTAFASVPASQNGNTFTWTFNAGTLTETLKAVKQSDGSFTWSWTVNGSDGTNTYDNWTFSTGTTSADGKSGSWAFYEYGKSYKVEDFVYSTDANNTLTGTWQIYDSSGTVASKIVIKNNSNNSGEVDIYSDGTTLSEKIVWIANGSGTWTLYNSNGTVATTGTWS